MPTRRESNSNIPTKIVTRHDYDVLYDKYQSIEKTNHELKIVINEHENKNKILKKDIESKNNQLNEKKIANLNLDKENKLFANKLGLAQKYYDDLKIQFDDLTIKNAENEDIIKQNKATILSDKNYYL